MNYAFLACLILPSHEILCFSVREGIDNGIISSISVM